MYNKSEDFLVKARGATFSNAVQSIIERTELIEFGIIKEVITNEDGKCNGVVKVAVSVAKNTADLRILTCVLIQPSASSLMIHVEPKVDDKVIVFSPRRFDGDMFSKENNDFIINSNAIGYSPFSCLAMLCNQFIPSDYPNFIDIEEGKVSLNLAYSEDDEKNLLTVNTTETGAVNIQSNDVSINVKDDNSISIDTSKAKVSIDASGNISIDAQDGKLSIKNSQADLFQILNGMLTILNSTLITQGSPASHTVIPNQFQQQSEDLTNLMQ